MKIKQIVACAALVAATAVSAPAFAGATGNVGAFSDYVFRGITQTGGAASVQGGLDYASDSGVYVGTWISNLGGGTANYETDFYGGYAGKVGDVGFDVGVIEYYYRADNSLNTTEFYGGLSFSGLSTKLFYSDNLFSSKDSGFYATANYPIAVTETVAVTPSIGYSFGDAYKSNGVFGKGNGGPGEIIDFGLTLTKTLKEGFTFSFGLVGTDRDGGNDETLVIGLKKSFDL